MNGFFRRFLLGDFGPPPLPDLSDQPAISGQTVVEILYHDSKRTRVVITCDLFGTYRIHKQFWDISDWKAGYGACWRSGETVVLRTTSRLLATLRAKN